MSVFKKHPEAEGETPTSTAFDSNTTTSVIASNVDTISKEQDPILKLNYPLAGIQLSTIFPKLGNASAPQSANTTSSTADSQSSKQHLPSVLQKKLSELTTNSNNTTSTLEQAASTTSTSSNSRKRVNSEGIPKADEEDVEMSDVSSHGKLLITKSGVTPPTKKRLVDLNTGTNHHNNNNGSSANSSSLFTQITSPIVPSNMDMLKLSTPLSSTINHSMSFSDDLQQLPLPSPSASPIQSGNLHEIEEDEAEEGSEYEEANIGDLIEQRSGSDKSLIKLSNKKYDLVKLMTGLANLLPAGSNESNRLLWSLLQKTDRSTLSVLNNTIKVSLRKDMISLLPREITMKIFGYLDYKSLLKTSEICRKWINISMESYDFWRNLLFRDGFISSLQEFNTEFNWIKNQKETLNSSQIAKLMYRRRLTISKRWKDLNHQPRRITLPGAGPNVITCLQFDEDKIVAGSDDHQITIYDTCSGLTRSVLLGHQGGVWAMKYIGNTLASGSTDRSVRIWNIKQGKCTHIFRGHTSTVRCLEILEPQQIGVDDEGKPIMFPHRPLLVTGSRDSTLYVWKLPIAEEDDVVPDEPIDLDESSNKYLVKILRGHTASVRAVSGFANTLVSISYDTNVRVWDLRTGECRWLLSGHNDRIYSCVLDTKRNRCISGSVDNTVRLWDLNTGETIAVLEGHQMLVGLITLSDNALVSAAADSTVRIWDPQTGDSRHILRGHTGAITCVQHDDNLIISGSNGMLKMWDTRSGKFIRDLLDDVDGGVWQVKFDYRRCVAAVQKDNITCIEILDFGVPDTEELVDPEEDLTMDMS